jgi:hypothetical protein
MPVGLKIKDNRLEIKAHKIAAYCVHYSWKIKNKLPIKTVKPGANA